MEEPPRAADGDEVVFSAAGDHVKGEFRCAECSYGITVYRQLPACPMCGCEVWEAVSWRPFGHVLESDLFR